MTTNLVAHYLSPCRYIMIQMVTDIIHHKFIKGVRLCGIPLKLYMCVVLSAGASKFHGCPHSSTNLGTAKHTNESTSKQIMIG